MEKVNGRGREGKRVVERLDEEVCEYHRVERRGRGLGGVVGRMNDWMG